MKTCATISLLIAALTTAALGQGTVFWDESVNGPLSNDYTHPTALGNFGVGTNTVLGMVEFIPSGSGGGVRDDYFTFQVPSGLSLTSIGLSVDKPALAWLGDPGYSTEIGHAFVQGSASLLPQFGLTSVAPGAYGFYMQNNDLQSPVTSVASYRLDFYAQFVPEPSSLSLLLTATPVLAVALSAYRSPPGQSPNNPTPLAGGTPATANGANI